MHGPAPADAGACCDRALAGADRRARSARPRRIAAALSRRPRMARGPATH